MRNKKGQFSVGNVPWNNGVKGIHNSPDTEFKHGCQPPKKYTVGTIKQRTRKRSGKTRNWVKVEDPKTWMPYAKHIWLTAGRKLIDGCVLHHRDFNSLNDSLDNLEQLTRKEHLNIHRNRKI